jgi:hypothetical protein
MDSGKHFGHIAAMRLAATNAQQQRTFAAWRAAVRSPA